MLFEEYLKQDPVKYMGIHNVMIRRDECSSIFPRFYGEEVVIQIGDTYHSYINYKREGFLYVMDEDGNKKTSSVFRLID